MFGTWNRVDATEWDAAERRRRTEPITNFLERIDTMLYIATAAFVACIAAIVAL